MAADNTVTPGSAISPTTLSSTQRGSVKPHFPTPEGSHEWNR
jgi:hypothetical protein